MGRKTHSLTIICQETGIFGLDDNEIEKLEIELIEKKIEFRKIQVKIYDEKYRNSVKGKEKTKAHNNKKNNFKSMMFHTTKEEKQHKKDHPELYEKPENKK